MVVIVATIVYALPWGREKKEDEKKSQLAQQFAFGQTEQHG